MKTFSALLALTAVLSTLSPGQDAPPEKALRYHEALLKRPDNATLFDRFFGAWLDEQPIDSLDVFLAERAEKNGGNDLAILARHQLRRGREDEALETLGKAIAALPEQFSLPMERARILLRRLDFENARKDLGIVAASPDAALSLEASKLIGKSWLREGNPEEAIKAWDTLLAAHPGDEDLLEDLVESAATEGEFAQALAYVDKLIAASTDPYKKTLRQLRRGDLLAQSGKSDESVDAYAATLAEVGEGSWLEREVLAQIEKTFRRQDRLDDLKAKLIELAEANPRRLLIHRQLAKIEAAQGEIDAAVGRFREVLKRSPGERALREEFVRLLTDGERYAEAAEELEKLIELAPEDAGLMLQMADLRSREKNPETTLAALEKARTLLGEDETSGIRIAGLMFQYDLNEAGEKLLSELKSRENATAAPSEALAAEYARTQRKDEALALLKEIATSENLETVLRAAASVSALSEPEAAFEILSAKADAFGNEPRFLATIAQAALAADQAETATRYAVRLVRLANPATDLAESIGLALRAINAADQSMEWRETLAKQDTRSPAETCLLAALADSHSDFEAVTEIMAGATDPTLIRFHAALLDRRGEFEKAIAALSALAETAEGRKASYFKDISDLQRRAGLTDDALATIALWKQSAPGDKTAWIIEGSILREEGRPEEAVKTARQAVARFGEDNDLAATLASLHEETGQTADAEAIYWRLYDEAASPSDQSRWAVSLAKLAESTGRTEELEEKLRERARGNRRSIGPILALAELARITRDDDKRRDLLLEAVRLQPGDVDLRLQIANLEEQSGNPDRVLAILEEAVATDTSGRVRGALAQAYLRQGQTMKGMRELRAMAGKQADDPRAIEQSAASLAGSGLYEEAIRFLREALPDGGDWRTRYLLAIMLEHDGRETEAIPIFQSLREAAGDIKGVQPAPANPYARLQDHAPDIRELLSLMGAAHMAYAHRDANQRGGWWGGQNNMVGPFALPDSAESVRTYALVHLAQLGAAGVENGDFIREITSSGLGRQVDYPALLAKYPAQPGLLEIVLMYSGRGNQGAGIDPDLLRKLIAEKGELAPIDRFRADLILATGPKATDTDWENLAASVGKAVAAENKGKQDLLQIGFSLLSLLSENATPVPENVRAPLSESLLEVASAEDLDVAYFEGFRLIAVHTAGTLEQWIAAANAEVEKFRTDGKRGNQPSMAAQMRSYMGGNNPWGGGDPFTLPTLGTAGLTSLPGPLLAMLGSPDERNFYGYGLSGSRIEPGKLLEHLDSFDSPLLRAYIAMRSGDEAAIAKNLAATFPDNETTDAKTLRALGALEKKDFPEAYRLLSETRPALSSDRTRLVSLNFGLLAIAAEMNEKQREEISADLRALLLQARRAMGGQGMELLAAHADKLGFPDLAKRFVPAVTRSAAPQTAMRGAIFGGAGGRASSSGGNATVEKMKKFAAEGKHEAAALEALQIIRNNSSSPFGRSYEMREVKDAITPEVTAALFKQIDPGDSASLTKLMEYADICMIFGKTEEALAVLQKLNAERPDDPQVSGQLAFLLPADQREKAVELISKAASEARFADIASTFAMSTLGSDDTARILDFFTTVASWLEVAAPEDLGNANLTWVSYHGKNFFERGRGRDLPSLGREAPEDVRETEGYKRYVETAERLALAMTRHGSIAEEGFRLLRFSVAWKLPDERLDALARDVIMAVSAPGGTNLNHSHSRFFTLRLGNGSSSSGDDLSEHSSASWLSARLASAENPGEILPPDFLEELRGKNPQMGRLVTALAELSDVAGLEELWKSGAFNNAGGTNSPMLAQALLARAGALPGAAAFFLERVRELKPSSVIQRGMPGTESGYQLLGAALSASSSAKPEELEAICSAIGDAIFGKDFKFDGGGNDMEIHRAISTMESLISGAKLEPAAAARLHGTFFRLGLPVGSHDHHPLQSFRSLRFKTVADAEKFLAGCGWLDDAPTWQTFAAVILEADYNAGQISLKRKEAFLLPQVFSYMNYDFSRSDLAKHLENRKPRTFGSLISAASLSSGKDRARLTELAFASAKLEDVTPERLRHFATVLPWLPEKAFAKLPPAFRKEAEDANAERLAELQKAADEFMKSAAGGSRFSNNPLDQAEELVKKLAPLDLDKAVAVFLEAERRFTDSLTRGGSLSSYTSGGLQITERDESMEDLLRGSDSPFLTDIPLALRFHAAIAASPEATRFGFSKSSNGLPLLHDIGDRIHRAPAKKPDTNNPSWLLAMRGIETMPEDVRSDARVALACYLVGNRSLSGSVQIKRDREDLAKRADLSEKIRKMRALTIGISGWTQDDAKGRNATAEAFSAFADDGEVSPLVRFQFASIALTMMPRMLENTLIAGTFASMYEAYAEGERSAINTLGLHGPRSIALSAPTEESKPYLVRINDAFWKNANAPKKGGHPPIPPESGDNLFLAATMAGDEANAKRLLASVRNALEGKLHVISILIANGQHDMARQLLPAPGGHFTRDSNRPSAPYDSAFERRMEEFRKTPGLTPLDLLRLEAQFKSDGPFPTGPNKPAESEAAREQRLADAFRANPPTALLERVEVLSALTRDSHTTAILLRDEMIALRDEMDLAEILEDWNRGSSDDKDLQSRYFHAPAKSVIFRQAAFLEFLEGDLSGLENLAEVISKEPGYRKRFSGRGYTGYLRSYLERVFQSAPIWICEAVSRGKTSGFGNAFEPFAKISLAFDSRSEMTVWDFSMPLAFAEFFAYWENDGAKFENLRKRIKSHPKKFDYLNSRTGMLQITKIGNQHLLWRHPTFAEARRDFLLTVFTRPEMRGYFGARGDWFPPTGSLGLNGDFLEIAAKPPEGILPTVLPHLLQYRANREFAEKRFDSGVAVALAAIEACPDNASWNRTALGWRMTLTEKFLAAGKTEEAKDLFGGIQAEGMNPNQIKRHKDLGAKIEKAAKQ